MTRPVPTAIEVLMYGRHVRLWNPVTRPVYMAIEVPMCGSHVRLRNPVTRLVQGKIKVQNYHENQFQFGLLQDPVALAALVPVLDPVLAGLYLLQGWITFLTVVTKVTAMGIPDDVVVLRPVGQSEADLNLAVRVVLCILNVRPVQGFIKVQSYGTVDRNPEAMVRTEHGSHAIRE